MRRALTWLPWILLVILGTMFWQKTRVEAPIAADGVQMPVEKEEPLIKPNAVDSYSNAVNVAAPAVVNIFTTQKLTGTDSALL